MKQHIAMTVFLVLCGLLALSEAHPHGRRGHKSRSIDAFIRVLERFGVCDAYNAATEEEQATCSEEFVDGLRPNKGEGGRRGRSIVDFICLEGGVTASSVCEILEIACNETVQASEDSGLEICPRRGNRQRRDDSEESNESGEEEEEEEEEEEDAEEVDVDGEDATTPTSAPAATTTPAAPIAGTGTASAVTTPAAVSGP